MAKKFKYSIGEMTVRLLKIAAPVKKELTISTLASIIGNLSQMGLMGFGAMMLMNAAGYMAGSTLMYGGLMALCAVLIVACRYTEGVVSHAGAYSLLAYMRVDLFNVIRRLAPACLMDREKGDIMNIAVSDIETIEFFFAHTIGPMFTVVILPCTTLAIAFSVNPLFARVLLPIYLIISIVFPLVSVKLGRNVGVDYRVHLGKLKSQVLESIYGLKDIQVFDFGQKRLDMVLDTNRKVNRAAHGLTLHKQLVSSAPTFFVYLARIAIIGVTSILAAQGTTNPAGTIVISFMATASFSSTQSLTMVVSSLLETYAAAERVFTLEDTAPEVTKPANPVKVGKIEKVEFKNVEFYYTDEQKKILDGFNLEINGNEKIGIVGESGIGKSTILRLLLHFWNVRRGQILVNGIDIRDADPDEMRSRIAVLEQDTFLFSGSIAQNIALGKPIATMDEIILAAKRAGIHDFIATLPQGYDTEMGNMGSRLSGGEKQRIGIARTMITDPDVIVMDEPTSSLDILHEKELLKTLREQCADKMILIVSHRPSTLTDCTSVVRLENGKGTKEAVK